MMRVGFSSCAALALAAFITPAAAKVASSSDSGFAVSHTASVKAPPATVWAALLTPGKWWNGEHSWSQDAANLTLAAKPGGCFCETLPNGGFAEHARVIFAAPDKSLRLSGALGPLQGEALTGTLTVTLAPASGGTTLTFDYVVGGYARFPLTSIAAPVDGVIGEQHARLVRFVETGKP
ncbi:SRPBCC domain-containing protein [Sphingobium phenoxybenzoativorans]|uniref:SRPBCC domain-containing protein n=1 Tax=Sphingobium phenoxybenzoativorans TaxID=1592790 RepID=A0A975K7I8_9SPHN|nr:SRPBCC domain-containing protein [Sphingobium phenoxybenzoativorans]QUT06224.1 SRPBCC domain-containing protein [Sphingobium phenoxybenzoativorans]